MTTDIEARDYLVKAAEVLGMDGVACLGKLEPFHDVVFEGDELDGLSTDLPRLRERLTDALARPDAPIELRPPIKVGFLTSTAGVPFGQEGLLRLLIGLESLVSRARETSQRLVLWVIEADRDGACSAGGVTSRRGTFPNAGTGCCPLARPC